MGANISTAYQFNFKIGNDLHNVYADNGQDAIDQLAFFEESILPALVSVTQKIGAAGNVAASIPVAPAATQTYTAPASSGDSDAGGHSCEHGAMKFVAAGISKATGKPYKAFYACPAPRGMQCKSISV